MGAAADYSYYRTAGGAAVDLVLESDFGRVGFEIKHNSLVDGRDLPTLRHFVTEPKARLGVVITNDCAVRQFDEQIAGLPFTFL